MDIRENWRNMRIGECSPEMYDDIMTGRRLTALERLKRSYKRFSILGFVMILMTGCTALNGSLLSLVGDNLVWFCVVWCLYFATCSIMDAWLYHGISKIDIATMPVNMVAEMALYYRKRHLQFIAILLPWALALVGFLLYYTIDDRYMAIAICIGFLAGAVIGVYKLMEFMADYRSLRN